MYKILTVMLAGLLFTFAGCDETATTANGNLENTAIVNDAKPLTSKVEDKDDDKEFMTKVAQGGLMEVKLGELAAKKAQNPEVKAFAEQMVKDHGQANEELKSLANEKNFKLPTEITEDQQETYDELAKLSGKEFDEKYVETMLEDHEEDVELFEDQAEESEDAQVKSFAEKTGKIIKSHYEKIKEIEDKMD